MGRDILQYYDGVVHHHTNSNGERTHRDNIERIPRKHKVDKRTYQGDRDGKNNDNGSTPTPKEEEDHQHNHSKGDKDGLSQT